MVNFSECVKKAKNGDADSFAKLYETVYKELYYVALCNLRNTYDAADAVSEAVLDAFTSITKLRDIEAFKGWMFKILTMKIKKKQSEYIEKRNRAIQFPIQVDNENKYSEFEIIQQIEMLNENEKLCFSLSAVCGYKSDEISELTGINSATVRSHLLRGKEKLKKQLVLD